MVANTPGPTLFWQTTSEHVFDEAAGARDARCVRYRSVGGLLFSALVIATTVSIFLSNRLRQTVYCQRATDTCVVSTDGPLRHERAIWALSEVNGVQIFSAGSRRRPEQGIELQTSSGAVRFDVTESCAPDVGCPATTRAAAKIRSFLEAPARATLALNYGPFESWWGLALFDLLVFLVGLIQLERVAVVISPAQGRVLVSSNHVLLRCRYAELPLRLVARCETDSRRHMRRTRQWAVLTSATGETYQLTNSGPFQAWLRRRFIRQVNAALDDAREYELEGR